MRAVLGQAFLHSMNNSLNETSPKAIDSRQLGQLVVLRVDHTLWKFTKNFSLSAPFLCCHSFFEI